MDEEVPISATIFPSSNGLNIDYLELLMQKQQESMAMLSENDYLNMKMKGAETCRHLSTIDVTASSHWILFS